MAGRELLDGFETVLVLGGGNALGAYHLGVSEALLPQAELSRIVGCSIGAARGAILLGNPVPLFLLAVALKRGEEVCWSTRCNRIGPEHILAVTAPSTRRGRAPPSESVLPRDARK